MSARLQDVRFELSGCTIFGGAIDDKWLKLTVCGHGMSVRDEDDAANATAIVSCLNKDGVLAQCPEQCSECSESSCGCLLVSYKGSLQERLGKIMEAAAETLGLASGTVQISVLYAERPYYFSAKWSYMSGSMVVPGFYFLENVWTYFAVNPTAQHLEALRSLTEVTRVKMEVIEGSPATALDISISSNRDVSLLDCLVAVAQILPE